MIEESYTDAFGEERRVSAEVRRAVAEALGLDEGEPRPAEPWVAIVPPGAALPARGEVRLEDGTDLPRSDSLPADAPYGYHHLRRDDGVDQLLICGPGRCHLPSDLRAWGWVVQLATLRSARSWGIGDLGDLRDLARWSADLGAGFLAVSPLGAPNPSDEPEPSPYYPSTRRFGNPLHLAIEELAGSGDLPDLADSVRALNDEPMVDRRRAWRIKRAALERIWATHRPAQQAGFDAWRRGRGDQLERWAAFAVLSDRFGAGWQAWPETYRDPSSPAVAAVAEKDAEGVAFHAWVQWCFERQLSTASDALPRIADMPVGVDPGGFDAWDWQASLAATASIGAPPDRFNTAGQDWGLPPFVPHRLRELHYRPFIDTIRAQLRHAGGLRIDHVLGLFRLWWIPRGSDPGRGAYVRYPTDELLEIVALESHRAGALIVGEDLGTVPPGVRRELRRRKVLSTRLVLFERARPARYARQALAAVTTHDLPTIAGIWGGADLEDQARAGVTPDARAAALLRRRLARAAGVPSEADVDVVTDAVHRRLAAAPSMLVAATLEDALGVEERPNLPGTTRERSANWSRALPARLEDFDRHPGVRSVVRALNEGRPPSP